MKVQVIVESLKGETVHLRKENLFETGKVILPKGVMGQSVRLKVVGVGPDVDRCEVDDYVVIAPSSQMIKFDPFEQDDLLVMKQEGVLAVVSYEETHIDVITSVADAKASAAVSIIGGNDV